MGDEQISWKEVGLVFLFGGFGGLLSWVASFALPTALATNPILNLHWFKAVLCSIVLGVGASYIGVYVVANSDPRDVRRFFGVALACGFFWAPVFDATKAVILQPELKRQAAEAEEQARKYKFGSPTARKLDALEGPLASGQ